MDKIFYKELKTIRPTSLQVLDACPKKWANESLLVGAKSTENKWSKIGTAAHRCLELICMQVYQGIKMSAEEYQEQMEIIIKLAPREVDNLIEYIPAFLSRYPKAEYELIGLEQEWEIQLPIKDFPKLVGHTDVVFRHKETGKITIHDHKTNRREEHFSIWSEKIQPLAYCYMLRDFYQKGDAENLFSLAIEFCIGYVNLPKVRFDAHWDSTIADDKLFIDRIQQVWNSMEAWEKLGWIGIPGAQCGYCSLNTQCWEFNSHAKKCTEDIVRHMFWENPAISYEYAKDRLTALTDYVEKTESLLRHKIKSSTWGEFTNEFSGITYFLDREENIVEKN
jgi:hypothetical protein